MIKNKMLCGIYCVSFFPPPRKSQHSEFLHPHHLAFVSYSHHPQNARTTFLPWASSIPVPSVPIITIITTTTMLMMMMITVFFPTWIPRSAECDGPCCVLAKVAMRPFSSCEFGLPAGPPLYGALLWDIDRHHNISFLHGPHLLLGGASFEKPRVGIEGVCMKLFPTARIEAKDYDREQPFYLYDIEAVHVGFGAAVFFPLHKTHI